MRNQFIYACLIILCLTTVLQAQEPINFNYQGVLRDSLGLPVPDDDYLITFRIFADSIGGGGELWYEVQPAVHVTGGLFNVRLGSVNEIPPEVVNGNPLYLEMAVGLLGPPLLPRMKICYLPKAVSSQRLAGDVFTDPGSIRIFDPQPEPPASNPNMEMAVEPGGEAGIYMFDPQPEPPAKILSVISSPSNGASIQLFDPQPEPPAVSIDMSSAASGANMAFFAPQAGGAALVNSHPQIAFRSDSVASRLIFQRAWSPGPVLDSTGLTMYADSSKFDINCYRNGASKLEIDSYLTGARMRFFDNFGVRMGVDPSPWLEGYDLKMYDDAGATSLILSSNGQVGIGTGTTPNILTIQQHSSTDPIADAWTTYSSRRWKTNIRPLEGALDIVMRLSGVSFNWIEGGKHDIGLIAEDVGKVVPEVVAYEENGKDALSVDYARLVALLIEAAKEQQKEIEELRTEINELKTRVK